MASIEISDDLYARLKLMADRRHMTVVQLSDQLLNHGLDQLPNGLDRYLNTVVSFTDLLIMQQLVRLDDQLYPYRLLDGKYIDPSYQYEVVGSDHGYLQLKRHGLTNHD